MNQFTNSDPNALECDAKDGVTYPESVATQVVKINRGDRWRIYRRLQELNISSRCPPDGTLQVEINSWIEGLLIRSTVQQFSSSRQELASWLERCWETSTFIHISY